MRIEYKVLKIKLLKSAGKIKYFGAQPRYELQPTFRKNGTTHRLITYVADFVVVNNDDTTDVIDVKGVETQVFKIKQKLSEYKYLNKKLKVKLVNLILYIFYRDKEIEEIESEVFKYLGR